MPGIAGLCAIMAVLTIAAALSLARPWWRSRASAPAERRASNVAAYRQRLDEIDVDTAAGLIAAEDAPVLRDEAGVRLLDDVATPMTASASPMAPAAARRATLILFLLLGVFAGGYYYAQGSWMLQRLVSGQSRPEPASAQAMDELVTQLVARLQSSPDDAEGWTLLGRTDFALQRYADAAKADAEVNRITGESNPDALTAEGEALALSHDRDLSGRPRELFEKALKIDPGHGKSLWYAGLAAAQAGDADLARQRWTPLLAQPLPDELRRVIVARLAELGGAPEGLAATPEARPAQATSAPVALQVDLSLAPNLLDKVPGDTILMVFARADGGPPMPLAVSRTAAPVFPARIVLDDSMGVMPTMRLSQFDRWIVTARLSHGGRAQAQSGDLQGSVTVTRDQVVRPLGLTIDQVVP